MSEYDDLKTGDIVAEALIDWKVDVVLVFLVIASMDL